MWAAWKENKQKNPLAQIHSQLNFDGICGRHLKII